MAYIYDLRAGRYRGEDGRFVAQSAIRGAVDDLADLSSERMATLTAELQAGTLSLADWQQRMMAEIKSAHVASAVAAHGGREQMSRSDWGFVGRQIRDQYGYLRQFAQQITDGTQPLDGRLPARARLYGQASRSTYEAVRRRDERNRGMTEERNVLHGRDHCSLCPSLSARGWVPIGTLPPVGSRPCGQNDRCTISYRVAPAAEQAA